MPKRPHPLIGRDAEIASLGSLIAEAAEGGLRTLLIEGAPGIGKTRLVESALEDAASSGFDTFFGSAGELDWGRPFGLLFDALDIRRGSQIANLLEVQVDRPEDVPGELPQAGFHVAEAIVELIERLAVRGPVLLALEDLQWADIAGLGAIERLVHELSGLPIALVATYRPLPRRPELDVTIEKLRDRGAGLLTLDPLDGESVAALTEQALDAHPGPNLGRLLAGAGGNPFFLTTLIQTLRDEGALTVSNGTVEVPRSEPPPSVRLVILRRLSYLSEETLRTLRTASVLGSVFSVTDLGTVSGQSVDTLASFLDAPLRAGVLRAAGTRLAFSHDLVREAIYEDIPPAVRIALHGTAARALADAGASLLSLAPHVSIAAEPGDVEAADTLAEAAQDALSQDVRLSARLLERAVDVAADDPKAAKLRIDLLRALFWSARLKDAEALGRSILQGALSAAEEASVRFTMGLTLSGMSRWIEALEYLDGIDVEAVPVEQRASVLGYRGIVLLPNANLPRAEHEARRALAIAGESGDALGACLAHHTLGALNTLLGRRLEAVDDVRRGVAIQDSDPTGHARLFPVRIHSVNLLNADLIDEAIQMDREGLRLAEEMGLPGASHPYIGEAWARFLLGEWDDAVAGFETALGQAETTGARIGVVAAHAVIAHIALHRGDLSAAEQALAAVDHEVTEHGPIQYQIHRAMWARALLTEAHGEAEGADGILRGTTDLMLGLGWVGELPDLAPDAVRLALATDDEPRARAVTEAVEGLPDREEIATLRGSALRCRGLLESDPEVMLEAVEAYRKGPRPLDLALACEDAGTVLASRARGAEGRARVEEALEIYERLGAERDAHRAIARLRALGVRRGSRGARRRPSTGWESLTPAELRVAGLVAEGLTNPQIGERLFLSRHTVGTHLRHVFSKLGMSSRVELARAFAGREP